MKSIIKTKNLSYKDFLHYPDMTIEKNNVTFISGESGCGKSTLLKLFNGTISPSEGSIFYNEKNISSINKVNLRREVLLVKQVPFLFGGSIYENFEKFHEIHETKCPSGEEIDNFLKLCCIPKPLDTICEKMSGGERQRLFLSIAISLAPKVLLLDEPTSALNKELSNELMNSIINFSKQHDISLVVVSHDMDLQSTFAEKVIEIKK